jgi:predicted transcriptional regulator
MTISLPPAMVKQMEKVQREEHRTRSELLREAWRQYFQSRYPVYKPTSLELSAIRTGRAAFKRGEFVTLDQIQNDLAVARNQARKKGSRKTS